LVRKRNTPCDGLMGAHGIVVLGTIQKCHEHRIASIIQTYSKTQATGQPRRICAAPMNEAMKLP
jgi:hypothetical protein